MGINCAFAIRLATSGVSTEDAKRMSTFHTSSRGSAIRVGKADAWEGRLISVQLGPEKFVWVDHMNKNNF
jgi:hypothetical protein